MNALVTGASGLIGANLVRALLAEGHSVRAFVRATSNLRWLQGLPVEIVTGDILQPDSLAAAAQGCDVLYHAAAVFSYWGVDPDAMQQVAVTGTQNVVDAAQKAGVRRMVLTSSSVVLGSSARPVLRDETSPFRDADAPPYVHTKVAQERAAFERASQVGLELVAVCPTIVVGPYDTHLSPSNQVIVTYLSDPFKLTFPGGINIVSAADVARGHILAAKAGVPGSRYLLGSENLEWAAIHRLISELSGVPGPFLRTNHTGSYLAAVAAEMQSWWSKKPPLTTRAQASMVGRYYWYRHDSAAALGFQPAPARQALTEAIAWLAASPHISQEVRAQLTLHRDVYLARQTLRQREARLERQL